MFAKSEINHIDRNYFAIIQATCHFVTVKSINTGHYWHILHEVGNGYTTCQISHKHHAADPWHRQCNRPNLSASFDAIKAHDAYHLVRKSLKRSW